MAEIVNKIKLDELIKKGDKVVVDFFATWCGPCQMYIPIFNEVAATSNITMVKVDVDQSMDAAQANSITSMPTTVLFENGKEVKRQSGLMNEVELTEFIK